jgi:hypothetical protein
MKDRCVVHPARGRSELFSVLLGTCENSDKENEVQW